MGVRLVRYSYNHEADSTHVDHDELINKDLLNQHPIYAITGLQEVLNILEDSVRDTNKLMLEKEKAIYVDITKINKDIEDINKEITDITNIISALNTVENVEDGYGVQLKYNEDTHALKAEAILYQDKDNPNALQLLAEGLYVPKTTTENTNTVSWNIISKGETLKDIYDKGIRFSHRGTSWNNIYSASEANAWYWDNNKQSFIQPNNTSYFTGFVTGDFYDYYTHQATIKSTGSDNDLNGIIIGFVFDENNNPHTLSVVVQRGSDFGSQYRYALVYDYYLPDQQIISYKVPGNQGSGNWSSLTNGITIKVTKYKNKVSCMCSNWNSTILNENTLMEINLNDYGWGYLFKNKVRYGYCNLSQPNSYFCNIDFLSDNTAKSDTLTANLIISKENGNAVSVLDDGVYVESFKVSSIENNILEKKDDGYYVKGISPNKDNAIQNTNDGFYVREFPNVKLVTQLNHGFIIGDFIYYDPSGKYALASAIDNYDANIVGMVTKILDNDNFEYQWSGFFKTDLFTEDNNFVQGMPLYIDINPGKTTQTQPDISKAVGYPVENIGLIINIERGIQYNQEAKIGDFKTSANTFNVRSDGFIRIIEDVDYKMSTAGKLLDSLTDDFKISYILQDTTTNTFKFINTNTLYEAQKVINGMNLFIKAF